MSHELRHGDWIEPTLSLIIVQARCLWGRRERYRLKWSFAFSPVSAATWGSRPPHQDLDTRLHPNNRGWKS
jgi:hypothetical protein